MINNRKVSKLSYILPIITLVIIAIILLSFKIVSRIKSVPSVKEAQWPVSTLTVKKASYSPTVVLYGKVESFRATKLEATINANVEKVYVKEGSNVKKGQLLLKLDNRDVKILEKQRQAEYNQIKAQIAQEKIKFEADKTTLIQQKAMVDLQQKEVKRLDTLYKKQVSSASALDKAHSLLNEQKLRYIQGKLDVENFKNVLAQKQAELLRAEANLDKAKLDIERTAIKAPYDGKVTKLNVAIGNRVQPSEVLIELFPNENIEVRAQIPTSDLAVVHAALSAHKKLIAHAKLDGYNLKFTLQRIAGNISEGQAGLDGIFVLDSKNIFIAKNRIVQLNLKLPSTPSLIAIPETAIFYGNIIYIVKNNRLQSKKVEIIGTWFKTATEPYRLIKSSAIKDNDLILSSHLLNARDGLKVKLLSSPKVRKQVNPLDAK